MTVDIRDCVTFIDAKPGQCWWKPCGNPLPKGRRKWCSDECGRKWMVEHMWTEARNAAILRDEGKCQHCGKVVAFIRTFGRGDHQFQRHVNVHTDRPPEVNHIEPRRGQGYASGCHNHLDNLETLCHDCHVRVTANQQGYRTATQPANQGALL